MWIEWNEDGIEGKVTEGGIRCVHFISFPRVEAEIEKKLNGNEAMNEWAALPSSFVIHSSLISLR